MIDGDSLYTLHASLLVQVLAALALTPDGAQARAYVSLGSPAFDCAQVTVHQLQLDKASTSEDGPGPLNMNARRASVNQVRMQVTSLRCIQVPTAGLQPPTQTQLDAEAVVGMRDQWTVWNYLQNRVRDQALFPDAAGVRNCRFGPAVPVSASGGIAGFLLSVVVELDGYAN